MDTVRAFLSKIRAPFMIFKKEQGGLPPPPPSCALGCGGLFQSP